MSELRPLQILSEVIFIGGPCRGVTGKLVRADAMRKIVTVEKSGFTITGPWEAVEEVPVEGTTRPLRVVPLEAGTRVLITGGNYKGCKGMIEDFRELEDIVVVMSDSGARLGVQWDDVVEIKE